ncbi:MAG TPA: DNA polymerase III subunit chi [Thermoanaerobaculaceae bacterium]|nr:DNA polymerase III subunit chi [Thermoanaerobaculaceae bacterium]
MSEVILHRLAGSKKALDVCQLVERLYTSGKRVAVWVSDRGKAAVLDQYLWTFSQNSFVPHALCDGGGEADEPVAVVTGSLANPNGAEALVVADRLAEPAAAAAWPEIHDVAAGTAEDEGKKEAWEAAGFEVREVRGLGPARARR